MHLTAILKKCIFKSLPTFFFYACYCIFTHTYLCQIKSNRIWIIYIWKCIKLYRRFAGMANHVCRLYVNCIQYKHAYICIYRWIVLMIFMYDDLLWTTIINILMIQLLMSLKNVEILIALHCTTNNTVCQFTQKH